MVTRVINPCLHVGMVICTTALTVGRCSLLPVRLLLVGHSSHSCGCSNIYNCASCWRAFFATSQAAPCWVLWSPVQLLQKLGCTHATVSVGAATKRQVAKDMALHVQYLLKSILCNSHEQIQQLMISGSRSPFLLYWSPSQECHHGCPITKEVTKVTGHQLTNEMQGMRVIPDLFLENPEFGHLLAGCQCPQSDFGTRQPHSGYTEFLSSDVQTISCPTLDLRTLPVLVLTY